MFTRRTFILSSIKGALMLTLIGRLYYLTIMKGTHYKVLSDKNRIQTCLLAPSRGLIHDQNGAVLAGHKTNYRALLTPELANSPTDLIKTIAAVLQLSDDHYHILLTRFKRNKRQSLLIKEDLTWDELSKIEIQSEELKGILIEKGERRFYPYADITCHTVGYVASATITDLKESEPLLQLPGFRIGKSGIEQVLNTSLQGKAGLKEVEVNAYGRVIRTLETFNPTKGADIALTIDIKVQQEVAKILSREESAGAVVMDIHNGAILALVSHPTFNAQLFTDAISQRDWHDIVHHPRRPLTNKVVHGQYAPGSIFKMMVALAALEDNIIDEHTSCHCPGYYDYNGHRFHCWNWKQGGHGHVTVQSAIARSCDTFFFTIATKLGINRMATVAQTFGFGAQTQIELPSERAGLIPTKEWKQRIKRQVWTGGDTINASIGQGYLLSTPLQQARMMAMLVNGLHPIMPHLIKREGMPAQPALPYKIEHIDLIKKGMDDAVNQPLGTAYRARIQNHPFSMGGKTASTQVSRITAQQRLEGTHNDRPYHLREHAMFSGFSSIENPRYSVAVVVEHGGGGARVAAPLARDILIAVHQREVKT